jgi:hypothetical protein
MWPMNSSIKEIGKAFNKMSLIALAVIVFISILYAADLIFSLGWGYTSKDLKLALLVLAFAIALRFVGLRVIAFIDRTY